MAKLRRGIAPDLLLSQVKNTMPYLFDEAVEGTPLGQYPPAATMRAFAARPEAELSHFEYFRLCLSAHDLTCATPVPTDVDRQIRQTLWPRDVPLEEALRMAELVLESRGWDFRLVSARVSYGAAGTPWEREAIHGFLGEWFTVSCGAYCALRQYASPAAAEMRARILEAIRAETARHAEIFGSLWRANDGIGGLKASASVAHNFGDLDRVMDMWELAVDDPLRLGFYKLAITPYDPESRKLRYDGRLWVAGMLYKSEIDGSSMALENHRHLALRKPRCLRRSPELLIPTGPFFDDWGRRVARALAAPDGSPSDETREVIEALQQGWERLSLSVGYGRALRGIGEIHPELGLERGFRDRRAAKPEAAFTKLWNDGAVHWMDEIPSQA